MFQNTIVKLTGLYLAIIMTISLFFSVAVYQLSVSEFNRGFRMHHEYIQSSPEVRAFPFLRQQLIELRRQELIEAKTRVLQRLFVVNMLILAGGGYLSYILARKTLAPIEKSHHELQRFTADASHELRTPLAAMRTENEVALMNKNLKLSDAKDQLNSNLAEIERLSSLTDRLLRLARGEELSNKDSVKLIEVVNNALINTSRLIKSKNQKIIINIPKNQKIIASAGALADLITILIDNASKYSPEKKSIIISSKQFKHTIELSVKDEGIGITEQDLPNIFERFYRADIARTNTDSIGYGLGLSIARQIADTQGISIFVKTRPKLGSTFYLRIPN
ncbi:MAG: HAMP domain-containing sensor histidine kinase [Patescibacteria group bacterium]